MDESLVVDTAQVRRHAQSIKALRDRFDAVKTASAHITRNDEAYGLLCSWIPALLEEFHAREDRLIALAQENLSLAAGSLGAVAQHYDSADEDSASALSKLVYQMPKVGW